MKTVNCPYTKISDKQAEVNEFQADKKNTVVLDKFSFVATAEAQGVTQQQAVQVVQKLSDQLTAPFLFLVASFFLFIILMSVVYLYHWRRFSMNDPFIMNFAPIYFAGLVILCAPLIFNLFF